MISVSGLDWIIVGVYLLLMLFVGFYFVRKIRNSNDYFLAGRSLGAFPIACSIAATTIGGAAMLGRTGTIYQSGLAGVTMALPYLIAMVLMGFAFPRISKIGAKYNVGTLPQLFGARYGKGMQAIVGLVCAIGMGASVATQISGCSTVFSIMGGDTLGVSYEICAIISTAIFIIYVMFSGLYSVVWTDVFQCVLLVVMIYIVLPIGGIRSAGGFAAVKEVVPESFSEWNFNSAIIGAMVTNFAIVACNPPIWHRAFAAKTSGTAKKGMILGYCIYGATIFLCIFIAYAALAVVPGINETYGSYDYVVPALVINVLPKGLIGLTVAGMLAVSMSSGDSQLLCSMHHFTSDFMKVFKPDMSTKQEIRYGRIACVAAGIIALALALYLRSAYDLLMLVWGFYSSCMACPALAGLFWKKATKWGIVSGIFGGLIANILWKYVFNSPFGLSPVIPGLAASALLIIVVSLITYDKKNPPVFFDVEKGELSAQIIEEAGA